MSPKPKEDPLQYLPRTAIREIRKKDSVYDYESSPTGLFLVMSGLVMVSRANIGAASTVVDFYHREEFFGESVFVGEACRETAVAMENASVMAWPKAQIAKIMEDRPRLGIGLAEVFARRESEIMARVEAWSQYDTQRRLAWSLIRFAKRLGTTDNDGTVRVPPLTHDVLSRYIGTSREITTHFMNVFRRSGLIRYSRKQINVRVEALVRHLAG